VKYAFIKQHCNDFKVSTMCRVMAVSKSSYYHWLKSPVSDLAREDEVLKPLIKSIFEDSRQTYGARRICRKLKKEGRRISRSRVRRLMKEMSLRAKASKKYRATTNSKHSLPVFPNLLNRQFDVSEPDTVYVGDITYIWTEEGWLYLAVLIDLYSRTVVGWSMSARMKSNLVVSALEMAVKQRTPPPGLILHSDRGSQYASHAYQDQISKHGFQCSMSRKGNCWDNAPAESFFKTLKSDLVYHHRFRTRAEAEQAIFEYIEVFYNRLRQHSSLDYASPMEYEKAYAV